MSDVLVRYNECGSIRRWTIEHQPQYILIRTYSNLS